MCNEWKISAYDKFSKFLKKCPTEIDNFKRELEALKNSNPIKSAKPCFTRNFGQCWVRHITKSYRLAYVILFDKKELVLICIGDHKTIYGKD